MLQDTSIHLQDAIDLAASHYHLLQSKKLEADAATKYIDVVKYSKLPSVDASYQAGLGTANNLTGLFYPNGILPISGPPSSSNQFSPATGSAASVLMNWQAGTFGQRDAQIRVANADADARKADWQQAIFLHKINVISTYLDILLIKEKLNIHLKNIERINTSLNQSRTLAITGLKPGVDTALFLSELSKAKIDAMHADQQLQISQLQLAQLIGLDRTLPTPSDTSFLRALPNEFIHQNEVINKNPLVLRAQSLVDLNKSKEDLLDKSALPKLNVWGNVFARGSGFQKDGEVKFIDGLGLNRWNYSAGVQVVYPILKNGEVKKQIIQQNILTQAAQENGEEVKSLLLLQQNIANTTFTQSTAIANESKQLLSSGQYAYKAMQTRYETGLVSFSELIQAQYNLIKAELDNKTAYWDVWKALLLQTAVQGDEQLFLKATKSR